MGKQGGISCLLLYSGGWGKPQTWRQSETQRNNQKEGPLEFREGREG